MAASTESHCAVSEFFNHLGGLFNFSPPANSAGAFSGLRGDSSRGQIKSVVTWARDMPKNADSWRGSDI
jgi:hypothetical protein